MKPSNGRQLLTVPVFWSLALALPHGLVIAERSSEGLGAQLTHFFFDAGQLLALGVSVGLCVYVWWRWAGPIKRHWVLALGLTSFLIGSLTLPESFAGIAGRAPEAIPTALVLWLLVVLGSSSVPIAARVGVKFADTHWRYGLLCASLGIAWANNYVLDRDYEGIHLFVTLNTLTLGSAALISVPLAEGVDSVVARFPRLRVLRASSRLPRVLLGLTVFYGLCAVLFPSNRMLLRLSTLEGAPLARPVARLRQAWAAPSASDIGPAALTPEQAQWFRSRGQAPPVPPTSQSPLPPNAIVILLTVDCFRGDLLTTEKLRKRLPYFREFAASSVNFQNARSPGAATATTLATVFSGKYYSQLVWKKKGRHVWPHQDDSVRFPELLSRSGVDTVTVASKGWLTNERRVVRGFLEQENLDKNRKPRSNQVKSHEILPRIRERLRRRQEKPLFIYAHIMDPHAPYDYGEDKRGTSFYRYVSELERTGRQLREFEHWLKAQGVFDRTSIIITADHGEAFGEHNTYKHGKTLYEELVRVPLLVRLPGVQPRTVATPVSLIDLGPTLLDLFGQPTPGDYMGQSLVPFLNGRTAALSRPIAAEAIGLQAIVFPNGRKAIWDSRRGVRELYDLTNDKEEQHNLANDKMSREVSLVREFFRTHRHPSYKKRAPFR